MKMKFAALITSNTRYPAQEKSASGAIATAATHLVLVISETCTATCGCRREEIYQLNRHLSHCTGRLLATSSGTAELRVSTLSHLPETLSKAEFPDNFPVYIPSSNWPTQRPHGIKFWTKRKFDGNGGSSIPTTGCWAPGLPPPSALTWAQVERRPRAHT